MRRLQRSLLMRPRELTMPLAGLYPRHECFACGALGVPFRRFLYRAGHVRAAAYLTQLHRGYREGLIYPSEAPGNDITRLCGVRVRSREGDTIEFLDIRQPVGGEMGRYVSTASILGNCLAEVTLT